MADAGAVRGGKACPPLRRANCQPLAIERLNDFGRENGFQLLGIGILAPEVAEYIAAAANQFRLWLAFHFSISMLSYLTTAVGSNGRVRTAACPLRTAHCQLN